MKEIDETRNCVIEEIKQNELISKKHKKTFKILNYTGHLLILASTVTGYISNSPFVSLVAIPAITTSSAVGLKSYLLGLTLLFEM